MKSLPKQGRAWGELEPALRAMSARDIRWREGKTALYVFNAGEDVDRVKQAAYALYAEENGFGGAAFPSIAQMERDVVEFTLSLLNAPEGASGAMTSGGTESILMALKTARDYARAQRQLNGRPNIVVPFSAHPAFDKAGLLMDIEVRRTPIKDLLADPAAIEAAIDDNTVLIVGSAPCFPFGLIDPIEDLATLARRRDLWLHVDACVGGFLIPFVRMNGAELPRFDFAIPGVASISSDLHKYGYASKGASTVLFRSEALRAHMTFDAGPWPLGRMQTPTLAGTRPGGAFAAAWAVMHYLGEAGYRAKQAQVVAARETIEAGVQKLGFQVLGKPRLGSLAFAHPSAEIAALLRGLYKRGWLIASLTEPPALQMTMSPKHAEVAEIFLRDLEAALSDAPGEGVAAPRYAS